ncbi:MAG: alpha/beta fold hydrolase [Pseudomonadota bacterium]
MRTIKAPAPGEMLREAFTPLTIPSLVLRSPQLALAPRGNGSTVLVWPGFGAGNTSTAFLRGYLSFLGYQAKGWEIGTNDGDVLKLLDILLEYTEQQARTGPVTLVGWSLGGYLAREVARDLPEQVKRVVTLGSPVIGGPKYTTVAPYFNARGQSLDEIERLVDERYEVPIQQPITAIYSRFDGVVAWQACIDELSPGVEHVQILSTHTGLGFSPEALLIIANRLARDKKSES